MQKGRRLGRREFIFAALMLTLAAICAWLGHWQMQRLAEKEALIAVVDARLEADPVPVPVPQTWSDLDLQALNYQPVTLSGTLRYSQTISVFTSLSNARGSFSGPGYWVMTPLVLAGGGTVFINRGFVPADYQEQVALGALHGDENAALTLTGLLRPSEPIGMMAPEPDTSNRVDWVRNTDRLAEMVDPALAPIAPFYVDLPAGPAGEVPQGGETVVSFPNNHFGYALTWYGFAIVAIFMLGGWLWQQSRQSSNAP